MKNNFYEYLKLFQIEDAEYNLIPITNSHINDTYRVQDKNGVNRYIIQRINSYVFPEPEKVMENIVLVTRHIQEKAKQSETLTLIPAKDGKSYVKVDEDYIRMYAFIEDGYSCDAVTSPEEFRQVAMAIARFHKLLADIDIGGLHTTIPDFHNTPKRLDGFKRVVEQDPMKRAEKVKAEIDFILKREPLAKAFEGKVINDIKLGEEHWVRKEENETDGIRLRVTHNDTKPANIMLHKRTKEAMCMIDLDTVMPGVICDDFGDAIRSGTCKVKEETGVEKDCGENGARLKMQVQESRCENCGGVNETEKGNTDKLQYFDVDLYNVFYEAFIEECGDILTPMEKEMLPVGAMKITYEQALRFLEDYLKGDVYFKVSDEEQNLRRARVQMRLLQDMECVLLKKTTY